MNKNDIINAVNNLDTFLKITELKGAIVKKNINGQPFFFTGGFTMVFQLEKQSKKWAFRVWHTNIQDIKERFQNISKYLDKQQLPYFAEFKYDEKGLLVNGELVDTIRMEWIEGLLLKDYIEQNLHNKQKLKQLAESFFVMCEELHKHKISHGDLQHGNIIIDNDQIRLIDYDSICVPDIEGQEEFVTGLKGYQHLSRIASKNRASLKADYFSELIIYLSIRAIAEKPELWDSYQIKESEVLLFNEEDFANFEKSKIFNDLSSMSNSIKSFVRALSIYLNENNYLNLSPFENYLTKPRIVQFISDTKELLQNNEAKISWIIENADTVSIDNQVGIVNTTDSINVKPTKTTTYKITAKNILGKVTETLAIEVFPRPISEFRSQKQKIKFGETTKLSWKIKNAQKVELQSLEKIEEVLHETDKTVKPTKHTMYKLIITALDKITKIEKELTIQVFKKVNIKNFQSNFDFIVESLPIKLNWEVENASSIILISNQKQTDVSNQNEIEIYPKKTSTFLLKASNDLFSKTKQLKIVVDAVPRFSVEHLPVLSGKEFLPDFKLNFKEISDEILDKPKIDFQEVIQHKKRFGLLDSLTSLLKIEN